MENNITRVDLDLVIEMLKQDDPMLTQSTQVQQFEAEWSSWLGVKHSVFVNSGSSANLLTLAALKHHYGPGEVIVPTLTWVSDIAAVLQNGLQPVFVDVNLATLGMDIDQVVSKLTHKTKAVFLTHILGFNGLTQALIDTLSAEGIPLIEDVCESHGAKFNGRKLGTFGLMSNFSFYYAHHMSTIEGGMISTDDPDLYQTLRMLRAHGMVRESTSDDLKRAYYQEYEDLNQEFIFALPGYNMRGTEIHAAIGRSQLPRLDGNNRVRVKNHELFLDNLDPEKYYTKFETDGSCNYALVIIIKSDDPVLRDNVVQALKDNDIEMRRGTSGGGNQLRQPYLKSIIGELNLEEYPNVEHVHFYGFYIGNYPSLETEKILKLCYILNNLPSGSA